jgi:hypothetical protein
MLTNIYVAHFNYITKEGQPDAGTHYVAACTFAEALEKLSESYTGIHVLRLEQRGTVLI